LGSMCFVCGVVLLGWAYASGRGELWSLGIPLTLVGQAGLIVGLVFQLENLWRTNRDTTHALDQLDEQLDQLQHTTTLMTTTHTGAAQSFYAHMAENAAPHLLLADLKGQLDLLAVKLSHER